ncbi:MAG: hypothetical protein WBE76_10790 [Terracidiphilus sp.]
MRLSLVKHLRLPLLLVIGAVIELQVLSASQNNSFIAWLCKKLKIDPGVYARVTRDIPKVRSGDRVVMFDKSTGVETAVWDCGGCWSPTMLDSKSFAVVKDDGIWTFTLGEADSARKLLDARQIRWILGPVDQPPKSLLIAAALNQNGCVLTLQYAPLNGGTLLPVRDSDITCLDNAGNLIRSGQVENDRTIHSSANNTDILVTEDPATPHGLVVDNLFDSRLNSAKDGIARFDPQWVNQTTILYLTHTPTL